MTGPAPTSSTTRTPETSLPGVLPLLAESLKIYRAHARVISGYLAWLLFPLVLTVIWYLGVASIWTPSETVTDLFDFVVSGLLLTLLILWSMTIIIILVPAWRAGKTLRHELLGPIAWRLVPSVIYIALIVSLLTAAGFIFLIIPGVIIGVWFSFAVTIAILKQTSILTSLKTSRHLVHGRFMPILWREYGAGFIILAVYLIFYLLVLALAWVIDPAGFLTFETLPLFAEILLRLFEIVIFPIAAIYQVILYLELVKLDQATAVS